MNTNQQINRIELKKQIKQASEYPLLGYCIYWSMSDFRLPMSEMIAALGKAGLDSKLVKESSAKSILSQALKATTKTSKSQFSRKVVDDRERAAFTIVNSDVNAETVDVNYATVTKAIIDKESKVLRVEGLHKPEIEQHYKKFFGTFTTDQFRNLAITYLQTECSGVSVRERGGVYFVPFSKKEEMEKLETLFSLLPNCEIEILPLVDTAQAKKSMWKALVLDIKSDIETLNKELSETQIIGNRFMKNRLDTFKELKQKAEMYGELMSSTAEDLNISIEGLRQRLLDKLSKDQLEEVAQYE